MTGGKTARRKRFAPHALHVNFATVTTLDSARPLSSISHSSNVYLAGGNIWSLSWSRHYGCKAHWHVGNENGNYTDISTPRAWIFVLGGKEACPLQKTQTGTEKEASDALATEIAAQRNKTRGNGDHEGNWYGRADRNLESDALSCPK